MLQTNRVRCALNKEILDLLNEESGSGEQVYKFYEKSTASVLKGELTTKVLFKYFGGSYTYKWTPALIT